MFLCINSGQGDLVIHRAGWAFTMYKIVSLRKSPVQPDQSHKITELHKFDIWRINIVKSCSQITGKHKYLLADVTSSGILVVFTQI